MNYFSEIPTYTWVIFAFAAVCVSFWVWVNFFFSDENQRNIAQNKVKKYFNFLFDNGFFIDEVDANGPNGAWQLSRNQKTTKSESSKTGVTFFARSCLVGQTNILIYPQSLQALKRKRKKLYYLQPNRNIDLQLEFYGKLLHSHNDQVSAFLENHFKPFAPAYE